MADNIELYRKLHDSHSGYGRTANRLAPFILPFARDISPRTVLDYGCGKSSLCVSVCERLGARAIRYDPAIPEIAQKPSGEVDLLINNDVLEHIPEHLLEDVLAEMSGYSRKAVITISTALADAILGSGENAHCTVKPPEWWADRLKRHFPTAYRVPTWSRTAVAFTTWVPSESALQQAQLEMDRLVSLRRFGRFRDQLKNALRPVISPALSRQELFAQIAGKSVAVVGNARSLADTALGAEIDSHDVVVRFNTSPIPHTNSHGVKTTWLATSMPVSAGLARGRGILTVMWMSPIRKNLPAWMPRRGKGFYLHPRRENAALAAQLGGARPTTGAMLLSLIAQAPDVGQIDIYGFDFFSSASLNGQHTLLSSPHDFSAEAVYLKTLADRCGRMNFRV